MGLMPRFRLSIRTKPPATLVFVAPHRSGHDDGKVYWFCTERDALYEEIGDSFVKVKTMKLAEFLDHQASVKKKRGRK